MDFYLTDYQYFKKEYSEGQLLIIFLEIAVCGHFSMF